MFSLLGQAGAKVLAYVKWDLPNTGRGEVKLTFFEYSNSKQYLVTPDIVEYDPKRMATPAFDLILGIQTLRELGIVLDF